jgi:hypothetical protein
MAPTVIFWALLFRKPTGDDGPIMQQGIINTFALQLLRSHPNDQSMHHNLSASYVPVCEDSKISASNVECIHLIITDKMR